MAEQRRPSQRDAKRTLNQIERSDRAAGRRAIRTSRVTAAVVEAVFDFLTPKPMAAPKTPLPSSAGQANARITARGARTILSAGTATARVASATGQIPIHFRQKILSKGASTTASSHQNYLERDQARDYLTDDAQRTDPDAQRATLHQDYTEREGAVDRINPAADYWRPGENMPLEMRDGIAVLGTIGETRQQRRDFWDAVTELEANPGVGFLRVIAVPGRWSELEQLPDFPEALRAARRLKLHPNAYRHRDPGDGGEVDPDQAPDEPQADVEIHRIPADTPGLLEARQWLQALPNPPTLAREKGRGGRIQYRIDAELPHELTSAQRFAIVAEFCQVFRDRNLPFFAALHRPDAIKNDPRNWHVHIDYYDRPTVKSDGVWDFETWHKKANRHKTRGGSNKDRLIATREWLVQIRQQFVDVTNRHLEAAGVTKRYSPFSYKALGVNRTPQVDLGPAAHRLEQRGILTKKGHHNAMAEAETRASRIDRYANDRRERLLRPLADLQWRPDHPDLAVTARLDRYNTLVQRQVEAYRRLALHEDAVKAEIRRPSARLNHLTGLKAKLHREATSQSPRSMTSDFRAHQAKVDQEIDQITTHIKTIRERVDAERGQLLDAKATTDAACEAERHQLLRDLWKLKRRPKLTREQHLARMAQGNARQLQHQRNLHQAATSVRVRDRYARAEAEAAAARLAAERAAKTAPPPAQAPVPAPTTQTRKPATQKPAAPAIRPPTA